MKTPTITVPKRTSAQISVRFTADELQLIDDKSKSSGVKPSTLIRLVVVQMLKAGIEVN
jgi:hypothetical protein